jgi:hypothetical protein
MFPSTIDGMYAFRKFPSSDRIYACGNLYEFCTFQEDLDSPRGTIRLMGVHFNEQNATPVQSI